MRSYGACRRRDGKALAATNFVDAAIPVYCNVTADAQTNAEKLRENLVKQITARGAGAIINAMSAAGAVKFVELGTGKFYPVW